MQNAINEIERYWESSINDDIKNKEVCFPGSNDPEKIKNTLYTAGEKPDLNMTIGQNIVGDFKTFENLA
ncbi:hypothetical protein AAYR18_03090 [Leuconostoc fallax]|uniref:hypothetical protein n=1 Tax=Leuconostoc fallax TaxID=1251 RepID=UPI002090301D|nr:hypothetical protein [Leuconostoc fallax]MCO6183666.1 hypothetical protein [Leuconostoc fallax]